jgi:hypothetical protein
MDNHFPPLSSIILPRISNTIKDTYTQYQTMIITSIVTATILLVTLAWNDVVQSIVNYYYPNSDSKTIIGKIYYAVVITVFVILLQIYVFPYLQKL